MEYRLHYTVQKLDHYVQVEAESEYAATTKAIEQIILCTDPTINEADITFDAIENLSEARAAITFDDEDE